LLDYAEEQANEIEALESIYPDEFESGISLHVTYTPSYPDELPEYDIETIEGQIPSNSVGMAMIFTMVMAIKEELDNIVLDVQKAKEEIINEKRRKEEEAEQAKFLGTKVTVDSFMAWKKKFDAEMLEKDAALKTQRAKELKGKISGSRQMFEQDKSLALSDAKYMDEGDVSVDASQFDKEERGGAFEDNNENEENAVWKTFDKEELHN
ncbi:hypothetical protein BD408DRAFT_344469, partial [Parasitella parasitica]